MTQEQLDKEMPAILMGAGVPLTIAKRFAEPEALTGTPSLYASQAWWVTDERTIVLLGGTGSGKSLAGAWALTQNREGQGWHFNGERGVSWRWKGGAFVHAEKLAGLSAFDDDDRAQIHRLKLCSLLVLDELGAESGDAERALLGLLSDRIENGKRSVITSNLSEQNFRERYRKRICSRIEGSGKIVNAHGPDLRTA